MSLPFYVPPEQLVKDRAEYARKGIARGRSIAAVEFGQGLLLMAENPSRTLHKISEVYDRIAFAGAGKFNEFEILRKAGIRHADVMGYLYSREDVTAIALANAFSQTLGSIFTHELKPYEVEVMIVELGENDHGGRLFKVSYDGTLYDERQVCVIGGQAEALTEALRSSYRADAGFEDAIRAVAQAFATAEGRAIEGWEAAILDATAKGRRTFRRLHEAELEAVFS